MMLECTGFPGGFRAEIYDLLESTSDLAKKKAAQGAPEGTVIIADAQTSGRGRSGKSFSSPPGTGLYMSLVLRPPFPQDPGMVTTAAAVAVCRAIEDISGKKAGIKWVNDVFMEGRKVCGILTEAGPILNGAPAYIVLGIGINLYMPAGGFPEEIASIAGPVFEEKCSVTPKNAAEAVLFRLSELRGSMLSGSHTEEYIARSILPGMNVDIIRPDGNLPARVLEVDKECRLVVQTDSGILRLCSGEVSIRLK